MMEQAEDVLCVCARGCVLHAAVMIIHIQRAGKAADCVVPSWQQKQKQQQ